jgi:hypothetical protein
MVYVILIHAVSAGGRPAIGKPSISQLRHCVWPLLRWKELLTFVSKLHFKSEGKKRDGEKSHYKPKLEEWLVYVDI